MPNPFLHISTFFMSIRIRSWIHTPTPHIRAFEFPDQHSSAVAIRYHGYEQHHQEQKQEETSNGSWRFVRVLVLCISRPFCMEITQFETVCVTEWVSRIISLWEGKHIQCIYSYIHTSQRKKQNDRHKIHTNNHPLSLLPKPMWIQWKWIVCSLYFCLSNHWQSSLFITHLLQLNILVILHENIWKHKFSILFPKVSNIIFPGNYNSLQFT